MTKDYNKRMAKRSLAKQVQEGNGGGPWVPSTEDLAIYAEYATLTITQLELAKKHDISQQAVSKKIKKVNDFLWKANLEEIKNIKTGHVQHLLHIAREAMKEWEKSKLASVSESHTEGSGPKGDHHQDTETTKGQCGDSRYLDTAIKALDDIRKITGANIPMEISPDDDVRFAGQSREQAAMDLIERLKSRYSFSSEN